jgi:hypothetical protein
VARQNSDLPLNQADRLYIPFADIRAKLAHAAPAEVLSILATQLFGIVLDSKVYWAWLSRHRSCPSRKRISAVLYSSSNAVITLCKANGRGCAISKKEIRKNLFGCITKRSSIWMPGSTQRISVRWELRCFRRWTKNHRLTGQPLFRRDMLRLVKGRCATAGLLVTICNHTFRGTGITVFLQNGGSLEAAQDMANHTDPRTTKLYDRRKDLATFSEIERRIAF